jgi:hypothetical protein
MSRKAASIAAAFALAGCCVTLALGNMPAAMADEAPQAAAHGPAAAGMAFDIAAQPLAAALDRYGAATGLPVFFDSALATGRTASAVRGVFAPDVALRALLQGTGLEADDAGMARTQAFVLKLARPASGAEPEADAADAAPAPQPEWQQSERDFDGLAQTRILEAFCGNPRIAPGGYRTAVRFGIDATGRIANPLLLHTTGDRQRDASILGTLRGLRIDRPPPPAMAQPITMLILPRASAPGRDCGVLPQ